MGCFASQPALVGAAEKYVLPADVARAPSATPPLESTGSAVVATMPSSSGINPTLAEVAQATSIARASARIDSIEQKHAPKPLVTGTPIESKLRTDKRVKDVYLLSKVLGMGGFSCVKLALERETGKEYACKIMSFPTGALVDPQTAKDHNIPCENSREDVFKEIDILCGMEHENIVYLKEYFEENNKVFLITELLTGGELLDAVVQRGSYNEAEARCIFRQILLGIQYLHSRNVVHRDLKLENLLLSVEGDITRVKIADFGLAKMTAGEAMQTVCGTPQYVAPEVILGHKSTQYGPGVDMWGAGVVLFILLGGYPPFYSESEPELFNLIRKGKFAFDDPVWVGVTRRAKDLISKLLEVDPARRLSAAAALNHIWFVPDKVPANAPPLTVAQDNLRRHFSHKLSQKADNLRRHFSHKLSQKAVRAVASAAPPEAL
ncbi:hypothetical protein FOA52_006752 [Chlamydomonas sp. UWO 241]|nr:hypothetical protein FOA52_006752 [Chlamydomonas sp. UWO 241]